MMQDEMLRAEHVRSARASRRPLAVTAAALSLAIGLAACDDNRDQSGSRSSSSQEARQTQNTPPTTRPAPGAAPSRARIVGTWTVTEAKAGSSTAKGVGDKVEGTTYRFEEGGKVTVAGAKRCTYTLQPSELKVDCGSSVIAGKIEFRDQDQTILWTIGANESLTLTKR
jgi:hypothetical protein